MWLRNFMFLNNYYYVSDKQHIEQTIGTDTFLYELNYSCKTLIKEEEIS